MGLKQIKQQDVSSEFLFLRQNKSFLMPPFCLSSAFLLPHPLPTNNFSQPWSNSGEL